MNAPMRWDVPVVAGLSGKRRILRIEIRTDEHGLAGVVVVTPPGEGYVVPDSSIEAYREALKEAADIARQLNESRR